VPLLLFCLGILVWTFFFRPQDETPPSRPGDSNSPSLSEAERIYRLGLKHQQEGDLGAAERDWVNLIRIFEPVEAEKEWVRKAQEGLDELHHQEGDRRWDSVRAALNKARALRDQAHELSRENKVKEAQQKRAEAATIWNAVEDRYGGDPSARAIIKKMQRDRGQ
jgi:hypothetical protein